MHSAKMKEEVLGFFTWFYCRYQWGVMIALGTPKIILAAVLWVFTNNIVADQKKNSEERFNDYKGFVWPHLSENITSIDFSQMLSTLREICHKWCPDFWVTV